MSQYERNCHLTGWLLFLICAVFFIASAARSGDMLYLVGSIIFFLACIAFIIPLMSKRCRPRTSDGDTTNQAR